MLLSKMIDENLKSKLFDDLNTLGLSKKEASVYTTLLQLGEVGSSKIIRDTGLHGQFVYSALGSLEKKGLVQYVLKNGRKKFSARNPKILTRQAERQKLVAKYVAEELNKLMVLPPEQEYEVVQGKDAYLDIQMELLEKVSDNSEVLVITGEGDNFLEMMGDNIIRYDRLREKKKFKVRCIGSKEQKEYFKKSFYNRGLFEFRILPGSFTGKVNTNIWPNCLLFNIFGDPVTCFIIRNPMIANSYCQFFESLWNLAKEK